MTNGDLRDQRGFPWGVFWSSVFIAFLIILWWLNENPRTTG